MRAIVGRIRRLENQLAAAALAPREYSRIVVSGFGRNSLVNAQYSSRLCPNGTVMEMIRLGHDPDGRGKVSDEELEQWIQKQREDKEW